MVNAINTVKLYPIEHIYYALTRFINNKTDELTDKYGRSGHLVSRGSYYAFQPNEIMDESASIFERTMPVDYKHVSLKMELPKEIQMKEILKQGEIQNEGETAVDVNPSVLERQPSLNRMTSLTRQTSQYSSYEDILRKIEGNMKIVSQKGLKVKASDKNWYKHANMVIDELLTVHEIPEDLRIESCSTQRRAVAGLRRALLDHKPKADLHSQRLLCKRQLA